MNYCNIVVSLLHIWNLILRLHVMFISNCCPPEDWYHHNDFRFVRFYDLPPLVIQERFTSSVCFCVCDAFGSHNFQILFTLYNAKWQQTSKKNITNIKQKQNTKTFNRPLWSFNTAIVLANSIKVRIVPANARKTLVEINIIKYNRWILTTEL